MALHSAWSLGNLRRAICWMLRRLHACLGGHVMCHEALVHPNILVAMLNFGWLTLFPSFRIDTWSAKKLMVHGALPGPRRPRSQSQETPSCIADSSCTIIPHLSIFRRTMMQCRDKFGSSYAFPDPRTENRGLLSVSITSPDKGLHAYGTRDPHG